MKMSEVECFQPYREQGVLCVGQPLLLTTSTYVVLILYFVQYSTYVLSTECGIRSTATLNCFFVALLCISRILRTSRPLCLLGEMLCWFSMIALFVYSCAWKQSCTYCLFSLPCIDHCHAQHLACIPRYLPPTYWYLITEMRIGQFGSRGSRPHRPNKRIPKHRDRARRATSLFEFVQQETLAA